MTLKLKELLKQKKMAANMLAEKLNVSPVTVSYWSTGGSFPSGDNLERIAKAPEVPLWRLFAAPEETGMTDSNKHPRSFIAYLNLDGEVYTPSNIEALLRVLRLYDERGLDMAYRAIKSE